MPNAKPFERKKRLRETQQEAERRRSEAAESEARREGTREQEEAANDRLHSLREETGAVAQKARISTRSLHGSGAGQSSGRRKHLSSSGHPRFTGRTAIGIGLKPLGNQSGGKARIQSRLDALVELRQESGKVLRKASKGIGATRRFTPD